MVLLELEPVLKKIYDLHDLDNSNLKHHQELFKSTSQLVQDLHNEFVRFGWPTYDCPIRYVNKRLAELTYDYLKASDFNNLKGVSLKVAQIKKMLTFIYDACEYDLSEFNPSKPLLYIDPEKLYKNTNFFTRILDFFDNSPEKALERNIIQVINVLNKVFKNYEGLVTEDPYFHQTNHKTI